MEKTKLEQLLEERDITLYRVATMMGDDPNNNVGKWGKKIRGERQFTFEEFLSFMKAVEAYSHEELGDNIFNFIEPTWVKAI